MPATPPKPWTAPIVGSFRDVLPHDPDVAAEAQLIAAAIVPAAVAKATEGDPNADIREVLPTVIRIVASDLEAVLLLRQPTGTAQPLYLAILECFVMGQDGDIDISDRPGCIWDTVDETIRVHNAIVASLTEP